MSQADVFVDAANFYILCVCLPILAKKPARTQTKKFALDRASHNDQNRRRRCFFLAAIIKLNTSAPKRL